MSFDDSTIESSNWRPRPVSTALAAAIGVTATVGLAATVDSTAPTVVALLSGLCLGAIVRIAALTERRGATVLTTTLATVSGLALLGALVLAAVVRIGWPPAPPFDSIEIAPFVLVFAGFSSGFGVPTAIWGLTPSGEATTALIRLFGVLSPPIAALVAAFLSPPLDPVVETARRGLDLALARGVASDPILVEGVAFPRFGGFFAVVVIAALALELALGRLPLAELAAEQRRDTVAAVVARVRGWLRVILAFGTAFAIGGVVLQPALPALGASVPQGVVDASIELTLSTTIRWTLLSIAVASTPAIVGPPLVRTIASERLRSNLLSLLPFVVGGALVVAAISVHAAVETIALERATAPEGQQALRAVFDEFGSLAITLGVVVLVVAIATALLIIVRFAGMLRFLGDAMGVQLISAGVLVAAIAAASAEAPALGVITGVASSLLVWDLGEFGTTLGHEIGRAGTGLGSELVHAVGAAVLAIGAVGVAVVTMRAVDVVPSVSDTVALFVTVTVLVGTLSLFLASR